MISPRIIPLPAMHPIQSARRAGGEGGTSSATGFPNRVIRTGLPVFRTCSTTDKQVALNLETAISSIVNLYHGH